jgi:23S rRNA pseudouridine2605 synthase
MKKSWSNFNSSVALSLLHNMLVLSLFSDHLCSTQAFFQMKALYSSTALAARNYFRADRVLANRTGQSRSQCFQLLKEKRVWQKLDDEGNFQVVKGPAEQIPMQASLFIDRSHEIPLPPPLAQVYCKPKWMLSVRSDPMQRPCISHICPNLHPVGRLDYDTSGLLLFSSSGTLTQQLLHPKHEIEKEYVAVVTGAVDAERLRQQLQDGVETSEGVHTAVLLDVQHWDSDTVRPYLQQVQAAVPSHYNQTDLQEKGHWRIFEANELSTVRLTVQEGKYRMVRRILANCGHEVVDLRRERLGMIQLGDLPEGKVRDLTADELAWAEQVLQGKQSKKEKYVPKRLRKEPEAAS